MSALRIPVLVMRTLIALTTKVLLAALVNKDLLEMALFAKVWGAEIVNKSGKVYSKLCNKLCLFVLPHLDIDECSADSNPCDENADCTNTDGSYSCTCKEGFDGNGITCKGMQVNYLLTLCGKNN